MKINFKMDSMIKKVAGKNINIQVNRLQTNIAKKLSNFRLNKRKKPKQRQIVSTIQGAVENSSSDEEVPMEMEELLFSDKDNNKESFPAEYNKMGRYSLEHDLQGNTRTNKTDKVRPSSEENSNYFPRTQLKLLADADILRRYQTYQEEMTERDVKLFMTPTSTRFGFSVAGGFDEGLQPRIDEIKTGKAGKSHHHLGPV